MIGAASVRSAWSALVDIAMRHHAFARGEMKSLAFTRMCAIQRQKRATHDRSTPCRWRAATNSDEPMYGAGGVALMPCAVPPKAWSAAATTDPAMSDRYIIRSAAGRLVQCVTERQALQKAAELFDKYGPDVEIEIYLNELATESILCSQQWMRHWNDRRLGRA